MTWFFFALLAAVAILALTRPLFRRVDPEPSGNPDVDVYVNQLAELERDRERGTVDPDEAKQVRAEIARRLLRVSRKEKIPSKTARPTIPENALFIGLACVVSIGSLALYMLFGAPGLAGQPLNTRLNVPADQQPVEIQVANVEKRLRETPNDPLGWSVIAPVYFRLGQFDKAANAYRRVMALTGESEEKLLGLAEALTFGNDGAVTEDAKKILDAVLERNPKSIRARFWLALLSEQEGRKGEAAEAYRTMLSGELPDAWKKIAQTRLAALDVAQPQAAENARQDAPADVLAGPQGAMIRGMVDGLAKKLKDNPADLEGWLMLIRSYRVLKETAKAEDAIAAAKKQFAADGKALGKIEAQTQTLQRPAEKSGQASSSDITAGPQGAMIRGMVDGLAQKLKANPADLEGWLKLIRSYTVLKETAKAEDAIAEARKQFDADADALGKIEALSQSLHIKSSDAGPIRTQP